jgi:hypothetical protein
MQQSRNILTGFRMGLLTSAMKITSKKSFALALLGAVAAVCLLISAARSHANNMDKFADRMIGLAFAAFAIYDFFRAFRADPAKDTGNQD